MKKVPSTFSSRVYHGCGLGSTKFRPINCLSAQMPTNSQWSFSDGWILMSVFMAHGDAGALLDEVIGAADVMNHAIPTQDELSRSLSRLASCGILSEQNDHFRIAHCYLPSLAKAYRGKGGLFATPDKGTKWLLRNRFDSDDSIRISITDERLSLAFDLYRKRLGQS